MARLDSAMAKSFDSKAFRAAPGSDSLKTTVPQAVATVLGLEPGDSLTWEVDVSNRSATVRRGEAASPKASGAPTPSKDKR
jgi:hypothetical protein